MTDATDKRIRLLCDPAYHPARVRVSDLPEPTLDDNPSPATGTILSQLQALSNRVQRLERLIGVNTPDTAR